MRLIYAQGYRLADYRRRHGLRGVAWLALRRPMILYQLVGVAAIERISGWCGTHVLIDDGEAVLDHAFTTTRFYATLDIHRYPNLVGEQWILSHGRPDLTAYERTPRRRSGAVWLWLVTISYLVMCMTGGRIRMHHDCVAAAKRLLHHAGVDVPRRIWTPSQLRNWLLDHGHPYTSACRMLSVGLDPPDKP